MSRGGKRSGAGRKKNSPEQPGPAPNKNLATEILASLVMPDSEWKKKHPDFAKDEPCHCEICLWRNWARGDRSAAEYLWNRRDGKPVHIVNHLHDKPIEMNVNVKLSEIIRQVRERKREYERNRR